MLTAFDDSGIKKTTSCKTVACMATDVQFAASGQKGHALHIIDISPDIKKQCNYETGQGFPKGKPAGTTLTAQEEECCKERTNELLGKYNVKINNDSCLSKSSNVQEFIECTIDYLRGVRNAPTQVQLLQNDLDQFLDEYPACGGICHQEDLVAYYKEYNDCVRDLDITEFMEGELSCKQTSCKIKYKND